MEMLLIDGQVNYLQHQLQRRCDYCTSEISKLHHDCNNLVADRLDIAAKQSSVADCRQQKT
uniref:Uncharacterized protein n=1 Tax=Romanomermis culicivorax TaxID=13658 RepID=A0A915IDI7_ROMCU